MDKFKLNMLFESNNERKIPLSQFKKLVGNNFNNIIKTMKQKIQLDVIKNKKYYGNKPGIGTKIKSFKNDNFAIIFNNTKLDYRIHAWDNTNHVVTCYFNMNIKTKKPSYELSGWDG